ncbi:thiol reductant ABC exporter subunit CydC [Paenibacillus crassostreae]|uniref:Amino acid ABC transporter ATP-binding protein n=1 Tax=Paenibacillus crassostreae TaxID=1763538 RepID=A0A167B784_9BACL|nr:thiol reductant ABC exporter subunit CydC [Paenibacillus crassostreae]AOZ93115.1 thiol reductant ABC exporter subunit CydC [Paenibacillus crassostreae]OAB71796.1 amino acid ABC transporter ATP-binding protein [Paenibacillus crassostreae]
MKGEQWLRPYITQYFWRFVIIVVLGALTLLTASSLMFSSGYLISKSALRPENILMVYVQIVIVRTFGTSRSVVHYVERLVGHDTILRILSKMRVQLYRILEPQALFISSRFRTGDILGVLAEDIEKLQDVYLRTIFPSLVALLLYAISITALGQFDLQFALYMALYLLILILVLPWISLWLTKKKNQQSQHKRGRLYQTLTDAVIGMSDWVISGRPAQFVELYENNEVEVAQIDRKLSTWARWRNLIGQTTSGIAVVGVLYWSGQQYADGLIASTMIAAFVLVIFPLMDAFLPISEAIEKVPRYQGSFVRLAEIEDAGKEMKGTDSSRIEKISEEVLNRARSDAHLKIDHASYRYDDLGVWSFQDITLDIPQGKKIAIIGRSGAGKSTLLKLIQGAVVPEKGSATIHGMDAHLYDEHIPSIISVLNQSPHLFDTTVTNNIRMGKLDATDEEIAEVARKVKMDRLIESLPEGYKTAMHETGQRFSGGERQRIALARVLLQDTPVVILDEPTVGLDPRTENELLATIFETLRGKSLVWVTHHLVGAERMDEIIFMENGKIEMRGSHVELMENYPRYRNLYHLDRPESFLKASD